jgi:LacI family transcriptional regulator
MAQRMGGASPESRPGPARIGDVAELAAVSVATVSRALNGDPRVDQQLRERVLAASSQLCYRPNRLARNLRRRQMDAIGMVVPDIENPHFARMVRVVEGIALGLGNRVLVCNTDEEAGQQAEYLQMLADERVSGILLSPSDAEARIDRLHDLAIPVVAIDRALSGASDAVLAGNVSAIGAVTRRLIGAGHENIAFVGGHSEVEPSSERQRGYLTATEAAGLTPVLVNGGFRRHLAEAAVGALLRSGSSGSSKRPKCPVSALVVANSPMTLGAIRAIRQAGLRIPDDIAVIAVDDPPWAELLDPPLTVLAQPARAMAASAVDLLLRRIGGDKSPPVRDVHPLDLIVRRSCGTAQLDR